MPIGRAALAGEVEQVPERLDGADVAGFLPVIDGCIEQFRAPEVADRLPVAVKDVQYRLLGAVGGLGQVFTVVGGAGRGQQAQPPPAAFRGEGEDALERRLRGDREVDALGDVLGRAVQLIEQGGCTTGTVPPPGAATRFARLAGLGSCRLRRGETSCCRSPASSCPARTVPTAAPGPACHLALAPERRSPLALPRRAAAAAWHQPQPPCHGAARSPVQPADSARPCTRPTLRETRGPWGFLLTTRMQPKR